MTWGLNLSTQVLEEFVEAGRYGEQTTDAWVLLDARRKFAKSRHNASCRAKPGYREKKRVADALYRKRKKERST